MQLARAERHGVAVGEEHAAHALAHADGRPMTSSTTSSNGRTAKGLSRYVPQKSQVLLEQPYVTCTIRLAASLGGRMTAPWYLTATMLAWAARRRARGGRLPEALSPHVR